MLTVLAFLLMLTVLVAAHEYGHYLVAKKCGMSVEEFCIGMGRPKWVYARKDETEFTIRPLPLGGFVRVAGMIPEEDGSETAVANGFYSKGPVSRIWMLLAGPTFSLLAGLILLVPLWATVGQTKTVDDPVIGFTRPEGTAFKGGLRDGDRILSVNGIATPKFFDIVKNVRDLTAKEVVVEYERQGKITTAKLNLVRDKEPSPVVDAKFEPTGETRIQSKIGIGPVRKRVPMGLAAATIAAVRAPIDAIVVIGSRLLTPSKLAEVVGGPETMFRATNEAVNDSLVRFIELVGSISMSLAIFNLLPISPLDGGQIMVAFTELLRKGRRLSFKTQGIIQSVGLSFVFLMFISFITIDRIRWSQIAAETEAAEKSAPNKQK